MHSGVYVAFPPGAIFPIADTTIQTPGQPAGTFFDFFLNVSISGSAVAFRGLYGTKLNDGIFAAFPPNRCAACAVPINMIADVNTVVPGGVGNFEGFGNVAIDPTNVAFEGVSNNGSTVKGIYTNAGGGLTKIIDTTDILGGKQVSGVNLGPGGFSGDQVAFEVEFTDGSAAIAVATLGGGNRCPLSQGYWKNHAGSWPEPSLALGNQNYSQSELLAVLNTPSNSDASLMTLARQLIAAKLNIFNSSNPAPAASAIADADGLLTGFTGKMSYGVKTTSAIGTSMFGDANTLGNYDDGSLTPGCTP